MIESASRRVVLGLRAGDARSGQPIVGLQALAWDAALDQERRTAAVGRERSVVAQARPAGNGALAFHHVPGLAGWTMAPHPWRAADEPAPRLHSVLVVDAARRYLPIRLRVALPRGGLLGWNWAPGDERPLLRAWPADTAPTPDGHLAVRATLFDPQRQQPAAWAMLSVEVQGVVHRGLADADGRVVVFVPQPRAVAGRPPHQQRWPISVSAHHGRLVDLAAPAGDLPFTRQRADLPTLDRIEDQPAAALWSTWTDVLTHTAFVPPDLTIGGELVLASDERERRLYLTPAP